jgi:hypothetical protein
MNAPVLAFRRRRSGSVAFIPLLMLMAIAVLAVAMLLRTLGVSFALELAVVPLAFLVVFAIQWSRRAATWIEVWPDELRWGTWFGLRSARLADVVRVRLVKDTVTVRFESGWLIFTGQVPEARELDAVIRERSPRLTQPPLPGNSFA